VDRGQDRGPDVRGKVGERRDDSRGLSDDLPIGVSFLGRRDPRVDGGSELPDGRPGIGIQRRIVRIEEFGLLFRVDMRGVFDGVRDPAEQVPEANMSRHRLLEDVHGQSERSGDALDGVVTPRVIRIR